MQKLLGSAIPPDGVSVRIAGHFSDVFGVEAAYRDAAGFRETVAQLHSEDVECPQ
jgi:hypothetical protein